MAPPAPSRATILAGDVGGTNTRLAVFALRAGDLDPLASDVFPSAAHASLEELVEKFLGGFPGRVTHAGFGVAGPVRDGRCHAVNLPWILDRRTLEPRLGLSEVTLLNDLEASAYGVAVLGPEDLAVLQAGEPDPSGNQAVIAAGTGLGEAGLLWDGRRLRPFATEGGHADFAPRDDREYELCRFLSREFGRVSVERVVSGPGLHNVYRFLRDTGRGEEPPWLAAALRERPPAPVIAEAALGGRSPLCAAALDLVVTAFGAEAGNLALRVLATGGVFVGGGIAPKNLVKLQEGGFMSAFRAKGRLASLMAAVPVRVVLTDRVALLGAARCAALRAGLID